VQDSVPRRLDARCAQRAGAARLRCATRTLHFFTRRGGVPVDTDAVAQAASPRSPICERRQPLTRRHLRADRRDTVASEAQPCRVKAEAMLITEARAGAKRAHAEARRLRRCRAEQSRGSRPQRRQRAARGDAAMQWHGAQRVRREIRGPARSERIRRRLIRMLRRRDAQPHTPPDGAAHTRKRASRASSFSVMPHRTTVAVALQRRSTTYLPMPAAAGRETPREFGSRSPEIIFLHESVDDVPRLLRRRRCAARRGAMALRRRAAIYAAICAERARSVRRCYGAPMRESRCGASAPIIDRQCAQAQREVCLLMRRCTARHTMLAPDMRARPAAGPSRHTRRAPRHAAARMQRYVAAVVNYS